MMLDDQGLGKAVRVLELPGQARLTPPRDGLMKP